MFKFLSSILFVILTISCSAQGSWDIDFIPVDTINTQHIGQIVRIDFKTNNHLKNSKGQRSIRSYVGKKDTGTVTINTTLFIFAERREIFVDHGSYSDQYLKCLNCNKESVLIHDAKIISVNKKFIEFHFDLTITAADKTIRKESKTATIDRSLLDGVLYQR